MAGILDVLSLIKEQLPKFATEMGIPFLGKDEEHSVMKESSPKQQEKNLLETLLGGAAIATPVGKGVAGAASLASKYPKTTAIAATAATGDPTNLIGNPILALGLSSNDAEASIRKKGRTDLNMVHNIGDSLGNFVDLVMRRGSVSNPSVAIAKDSVYPFSRSPTLIMNPASHSFDPGMNPLNQLINRDMYATRAKVPSHSASQISFRRDANIGEFVLDKSFQDQSTLALRQGKDARFTEGGGPPEASQAAAIMASPKFKDFANYEKSPAGAKILTNDDVTIESENVARAYKDWLNDELPFNVGEGVRGQPVSSSIRNEDNFKWLTNKASTGDAEAKRLLKQLQEIPSNYAELKVVGELGIRPKNVSALMIPKGHAADINAASLIRQFSDETGIRAGTAGDLLPPQHYDLYGEITDKLAEAAYNTGGNLSSKYNALPQVLRQYIDSPNYLNSIDNANSAGEAQTAAGRLLTGSNKFAADVASMLTASDLDSASTANILKKLLENSK